MASEGQGGGGEIHSGSLAGRLGVVNGEGAIAEGLRAALTYAGGQLMGAAGVGEPGQAYAIGDQGRTGPGPGVGKAGIGPVPSFWIEVIQAPPSPRSFVDLDDQGFKTDCEDVMWMGVKALQASLAFLSGTSGTVLIVVPTLSLAGTTGQVAYASGLEGLRALVKSAARQWGHRGVRVNCLTLAPELFGGGVGESTGTSLGQRALGGTGEVEHDIAPVAVFLCGPEGHFVTGLTLCLDGGTWMGP
ncbi:MAG: SDR family oxidoreductase [Acidimicrobiales bacterium]